MGFLGSFIIEKVCWWEGEMEEGKVFVREVICGRGCKVGGFTFVLFVFLRVMLGLVYGVFFVVSDEESFWFE